MDIQLRNSIIIIDEAHNLLDTISAIHSAEIRLDQIQQSQRQLSAYKNKYIDRFGAKNLLRLNQLISIANRLSKLFSGPKSATGTQPVSRMVHVYELMDDTNVTPSSLIEILRFVEHSRLAQKVHGFSLRYGTAEVTVAETKPKETTASYLKRLSEQQMQKSRGKAAAKIEEIPVKSPVVPAAQKSPLESASVLRLLLAFLECLLEESTDGRILISQGTGSRPNASLKYLLLNPSNRFADVLSECRAVIVAGGTMQPTTEFTEQLFAKQKDRIEQHFFGHVVAAEAVLPIVVGKGPKNSSFLFNFANRGNREMVSSPLTNF